MTKKNKNKLVRLSVNINHPTAQAMREMAARRDISFTEVVRRAISIYKFIEDERSAGRVILTMHKNGSDVTELRLR